MRMLQSIAFVVGLAASVTPAGQDGDKPATKQDVQDLKAEVQDLKSLLVRILELDEQRLSGLRAVLNDARARGLSKPVAIEHEATAKSDKVQPSSTGGHPRSANEAGSISGHVAVSGHPGALVYVYIEDLPGKLAKSRQVEVKQVEKEFVPSALVVQRGTKVVFPNLDKISHNVFSLTPGAQFDLGTYQAGDKAGAFTFTQPGPVEVFCNLHSQMAASILVVPNEHYAKVGPDGRFLLKGVPPGRRKIAVWTPNVPPSIESVEVSPGQEARVELSIQASSAAPKHTDKNGMPYGSYQ
jgi:plastocyanin